MTMAMRDDGALLIPLDENGEKAALLSRDGSWLVTVGAAMARGRWFEHIETLSSSEEQTVADLLAGE